MSLINKMLQDLEERQPSTEKEDAFHAAVRPVAIHAGIHPAWRIGAIAALVAAGASAWFWHRADVRSREIPRAVQQAQFPLKLDHQLSLNLKGAGALGANNVASLPSSDNGAPREAVRESEVRVEPVSMQGAESKKSAAQPRLSPGLNMPSAAADRLAEPKAISSVGSAKHEESVSGQSSVPAQAAVRQRETVAQPLELTKQVRELSPHDKAENEYRKAAALIQQARLGEATASLEQALAFDPRHVGARQALIGLLLDAKRNGDALRSAQSGLALDPTQAGLAMIAARLQVDKGDLQAAIDTLQRTLPSGAERGDYQAFLAALMQRAGNHKEAIAHYVVAVRIAPQNGVWWMGLGISLQAEQRKTDALEAFTRAKSSDNLSPELKAFIDQRLAQLQR